MKENPPNATYDSDEEIIALVNQLHETQRRLQELTEGRSGSDWQVNEELFASAFQSAAMGMALGTPFGKYLKVNAALCQMLGYTEEELVKISYLDVSHPAELSEDNAKMKALLAGEYPSYQIEKRYLPCRMASVASSACR